MPRSSSQIVFVFQKMANFCFPTPRTTCTMPLTFTLDHDPTHQHIFNTSFPFASSGWHGNVRIPRSASESLFPGQANSGAARREGPWSLCHCRTFVHASWGKKVQASQIRCRKCGLKIREGGWLCFYGRACFPLWTLFLGGCLPLYHTSSLSLTRISHECDGHLVDGKLITIAQITNKEKRFTGACLDAIYAIVPPSQEVVQLMTSYQTVARLLNNLINEALGMGPRGNGGMLPAKE